MALSSCTPMYRCLLMLCLAFAGALNAKPYGSEAYGVLFELHELKEFITTKSPRLKDQDLSSVVEQPRMNANIIKNVFGLSVGLAVREVQRFLEDEALIRKIENAGKLSKEEFRSLKVLRLSLKQLRFVTSVLVRGDVPPFLNKAIKAIGKYKDFKNAEQKKASKKVLKKVSSLRLLNPWSMKRLKAFGRRARFVKASEYEERLMRDIEEIRAGLRMGEIPVSRYHDFRKVIGAHKAVLMAMWPLEPKARTYELWQNLNAIDSHMERKHDKFVKKDCKSILNYATATITPAQRLINALDKTL